MRYQVKWTVNGETKYGIFREEVGDTAIVDDLILPKAYRVKTKDLTDIPLGWDRSKDEVEAYREKAFKAATAASERCGGHPEPGALFSVGVADGSAWYVVTKGGKRQCQIEWRGFCPDRYRDHYFGLGGSFPTAKIATYVARADAADRLFSPARRAKAGAK